jgi:hypothetical protein
LHTATAHLDQILSPILVEVRQHRESLDGTYGVQHEVEVPLPHPFLPRTIV